MIQTLCDTGDSYKIPRSYDGAVYSLLPDCIIGGIGDEFAIETDNLTATIKSGQAVINGNFLRLTDSETISLTASTTAYLCLSIDTTKENGSRGFLSFKLESDIKSENINGSGTLRDFPLYKITTSTTEATSISDVRKIVKSGDTVLGVYTIIVCTEDEYNAMASHDSSTLYFVYSE